MNQDIQKRCVVERVRMFTTPSERGEGAATAGDAGDGRAEVGTDHEEG